MTRALVIGCGNTLRGDDALGPRIAELLAEQEPQVAVEIVAQLLPELAELVARSGLVVFVDARVDRAEQGVLCERLAPADRTQPWVGHLSDPRALLALSSELYGARPTAFLVSAPGCDFELGERLSKAAAHWVPVAAAAIAELLTRARELGSEGQLS
jgi:hydrogenase maturation protease